MTDVRCTWEEGPGGKFAVRGVPIFALGEHRGFTYDESWARRALRTFALLKKEHGYLPPVVMGHTTDDGEEKPAVGFLDRLRLVGSQIVADIVGLSKEVFEEIRAGRWPYRSVEVFDKAAQITALALLGGTPPQMKSAPLHFADDGTAAVWVEDQALPGVFTGRHGDGGTMQENEQGAPKRFSEEEVERLVDAARVEERSRMSAELNQTKKRLAELESAAHLAQVNTFRIQLRELGYAPAIVDAPETSALIEELSRRDEPVRFSEPARFGQETVKPLALFGRVLGLIAERAAQGNALMETGERAQAGRFRQLGGNGDSREDDVMSHFGGRVDPASARRFVQARELMKEEGITFREALVRVSDAESV